MPLGNGYLEDGLITLRLVFMSRDVRTANYTELTEGSVRWRSLVLAAVNLCILLP